MSKEYKEYYLKNPFQSCHAADLLELPDKDLLCCWFSGTREGNADVSIMLSRLNARTDQWSDPVKVSDDEERSEQNPSLFLAPDGVIWLVFTAQEARVTELGRHRNLQYTAVIRCKKSFDNGYTWQETEDLFTERGSFCRQKIQVLSNGRFLFGNWMCRDDDSLNASDTTVIRISDDQGKTWSKVPVPQSRGLVHCNLVERENGRVLAFFRSRFADAIYLSVSRDYGMTWSRPEKTELPNNNASISAAGLANGRIAVVYNACGFHGGGETALWPRLRTPVTIAISDNEGKSFDYRRIIEFSDGYCGKKNSINNRRHEYPVILPSRSGKLYVAYTWSDRRCIKVVSFDEQWVYGEKCLDEGMEYRM